MKKKLYVFTIESQYLNSSSQSNLREGIIKLLEIAPIYFNLEKINDDKIKRTIKDQDFTFETAEEARQLALKILKTEVIFFCNLREIEVC